MFVGTWPQLLLDNPVLSLLTTPFEHRAAFVDFLKDKRDGEAVSIWASSGVEFELLHLTLPKGTRIERPGVGQITIKDRRFFLRLAIRYDGYATSLPRDFEVLYLGEKAFRYDQQKVVVSLTYGLNPVAALFSRDWSIYRWLDSFADKIQTYSDFDSFLNRISWISLRAQTRVNVRLMNGTIQLTQRTPPVPRPDSPEE